VPGLREGEVLELVAFYRERFGVSGLFENRVYGGIPELLGSLRGMEGRKLYLATAKPHVFAKRIMAHFGLAAHFHALHGSELSGVRSDKGELVAYILETEKIPPREAMLVGDTKFDVLGAKKNGILSAGVSWGYGPRAELEAAGADYIFDRPAELGEFLRA
jgi:phosphoglycolate phosphatase